jgi:predicted AAA+ superfamily ATPase
VTSIVLREIRDISSIQSATDLPRILRLLAARTSSILNVSEVSRAAGIAHTTLTRYLALLEATYLFWRLPAWSGNLGKRCSRIQKSSSLTAASQRRSKASMQVGSWLTSTSRDRSSKHSSLGSF